MKRTIYIVLTTLLGIIVSYGVHALIEIGYLRWAENAGVTVSWTKHLGVGSCALPTEIQYGLLAAGAIGGFFIGRVWWRWVYIEKRHWRHRD